MRLVTPMRISYSYRLLRRARGFWIRNSFCLAGTSTCRTPAIRPVHTPSGFRVSPRGFRFIVSSIDSILLARWLSGMFISAPTLDDLLRRVLTKLLASTSYVTPTKGATTELTLAGPIRDNASWCYSSDYFRRSAGENPSELGGTAHASGHALRQKWRCSYRLPGVWRGSGQSGSHSALRVKHRKLLDLSGFGALAASFGKFCAGGNVRQARDRHVGSGQRTSRRGPAHRRPAGSDGRRRHGAGGVAWHFRRRSADGPVRRHLPGPVPCAGALWELCAIFVVVPDRGGARGLSRLYRPGLGFRRQPALFRAVARE